MNKFLYSVVVQFFIVLPLFCSIDAPLIVPTIYGTFAVDEPVLIDVFYSPAMERIKYVHQSGANDYVDGCTKDYTRYEHCVGVWALLKMYGASLEEQIAGLLHDASHTVFSHVGDRVFDHTSFDSSYQDDIHEWYLLQQKVEQLLERHALSLDAVLHKSGNHQMLEQDLPNICADRLEYNLHTALLLDLISLDDITQILDDLRYEDGLWFFSDKDIAQKFASISLYCSEHVWGGPENHFINENMACVLKRALEIGLITIDDIHFSTDDVVWNVLCSCNDEAIIACFNKIHNHKDLFVITDHEDSDFIITNKFRGIDPFILTNDVLMRLTDLDVVHKKEYERVKQQVSRGWGIRVK